MTSDTRAVKTICCYSCPSQQRVQTGFRVWEVAHRLEMCSKPRVWTQTDSHPCFCFTATFPVVTCFVGILLEFSSTGPADSNTCSVLESAEGAPDKLGWDDVHVVQVEHLASEMPLSCSQNPLQCVITAGTDGAALSPCSCRLYSRTYIRFRPL